MSKLDTILGTNIYTYDGGESLVFSLDSTKAQLKALFNELVGSPDFTIDPEDYIAISNYKADLRKRIGDL